MKNKNVAISILTALKAVIRFLYAKIPTRVQNKVDVKAFATFLVVVLLALGGSAWAIVATVGNADEQSISESTATPEPKQSDDNTTSQDQPVQTTEPAASDTPASSTPDQAPKKPSPSTSTTSPAGGGTSGSGDGSAPSAPLYGKLTLSTASVTLSKSGTQTAPITITAPVTVTTPGTSSQGSPIVLANGAPSGTTFTMTVIMNANPAAGTYSVPIQAIHNGSGTRYYTATLTVLITD